MNGDICLQRTAAPWLGGFLATTVIISVMSQREFCGLTGVDHFFCEFTPLLELSHSDTNLLFRSHPPLPVHMGILCMHQSCSAGADLPSSMRRQKAFSTCSSQPTSATVFYDTLILGCMLPRTAVLREFGKAHFLHHPQAPAQSPGGTKRTWTGMCCVLTNPLEAWDMEKAFGVSRGREVCAGGARWCHRETSFQHVGKAREIREVPRSSEKANIKPMFKKGKKEDWENDRLVSFPSVPGKVMGQVLLQPSPGT
ncbi:hypothetical protein QYF61_013973 [Mycteria americana]|uniref:Uncharacterized protein n=1 Tax=Mycteria americana TaxID=33587 RepID=A0AAN7RKH4_MYCAM|nr:hypothetical protein QYF61_013973 [Mycteria americana]